jgi:hypothetical protein
MTIPIFDRFGKFALSFDDGEKLHAEIEAALDAGENVVLDFARVQIVASDFMCGSIGKLYERFSSEMIRERLDILGLADWQLETLRLVVENAKEYFAERVAAQE